MFGKHLHRIELDDSLSRGLDSVREAVEFLQKNGETVIEVKIDHEDNRCFNNDFIARIVTVRKGKAHEQHS